MINRMKQLERGVLELHREVDARDAEIAELKESLGRIRKALGPVKSESCHGHYSTMIEKVIGEMAELRKDAERYQWLTQHAYIGECGTDKGKVLEVCNTDREVPSIEYPGYGKERVNAAIDAAIAREKQ